MRVLSLLIAGTFLLCAAARAQEAIPDVRTLDDLKNLNAIHLDNWDVRIGLADGGEDAGPWKLLYCWAEYTGKGEPQLSGTLPGEPLGPVSFHVFSGETRLTDSLSKVAAGLNPDRQRLYCGMVLTPFKGTWHIEVSSWAKKLLLTRDVTVTDPRPCYWQIFAAEQFPGEGRVITLPETQEAFAAHPCYDGLMPLLRPGAELPKGAASLPGTIPLDAAWFAHDSLPTQPATRPADAPLALSLEANTFIIRSRGDKMDDHTAQRLLARWWVNGQPVVPPISPRPPKLQAEARAVGSVDPFRVPFGLPQHLGQLKAGDRIGLQVLYTPGALNLLPRPEWEGLKAMRSSAVGVPVQSNRIEFVLTEELLRLQTPATRPAK